MPKKANKVSSITAVQAGFGFPAVDGAGNVVPWAPFDPAVTAAIKAAPFKGVDLETTGLVASSVPVNLTMREIHGGFNARLRVRVATVSWPENGRMRKIACDLDQYSPEQQEAMADAMLSGTLIAHNASFDCGWLAGMTDTRPERVLDTMLISRILSPDQPIQLARMAGEYDPESPSPDPVLKAAYDSVMGKASGWALADLILVNFRHIMPKDLQGPANWTPEVLSAAHYEYAADDVDWMLRLLAKLVGADQDNPVDILDKYLEVRKDNAMLRRREYLVPDLVEVRLHGIPVDRAQARKFAAEEYSKAASFAVQMGQLEPDLARFVTKFADPDQGLDDAMKRALAAAFKRRGLALRTTATGAYQVGEKDLRLAGAMQNPESRPLFEAWVGVARSKKRAQMALDWEGFSKRSPDGRLHPLLSPAPGTDRLSASEPNSQQAPRDQGFRAIIRGRDENWKILAVDYSALDMRHGAALAVRAQEEILEAYAGTREVVTEGLLSAVRYAIDTPVETAQAALQARLASVQAELAALDQKKVDGKPLEKGYWSARNKAEQRLKLARFALRLLEVTNKARAAGTRTWSALRDAFSLGVDIHTYTAMGMAGHDPAKEFSGLSGAELEAVQKKWKKQLTSGSRDLRQNGKIANLSLLYAMMAAGLQEAAGKNYDVHWTLEEADEIIRAWMNAYPEVELWHLWTDLNVVETVWAPDPDRGGRRRPYAVYHTKTLAGRPMHVRGLNSALAYPDQGSGADLLEAVLHVLRVRHPDTFQYVVNQVHDELVFEVPATELDAHRDLVSKVMDDVANRWLGLYGVVSANSPAAGDVWMKD